MPAPHTRATAQKKGSAEVAPSKPSQNPNNPRKGNAVSEQQHTSAPADPARVKKRQDAINEMENAILDAKMFALLLGSVINAIGLDRAPALDADHHSLNEDESEQIVYVALKLENVAIKANRAFEEAFGSGEVAA